MDLIKYNNEQSDICLEEFGDGEVKAVASAVFLETIRKMVESMIGNKLSEYVTIKSLDSRTESVKFTNTNGLTVPIRISVDGEKTIAPMIIVIDDNGAVVECSVTYEGSNVRIVFADGTYRNGSVIFKY